MIFKHNYLFFLLCLSANVVIAQDASWTSNIATIIHDNCSSCHHEGAIAPFELMVYEDVVGWGDLIHHVVEERRMPPWPADPNYRHFVNEAVLEQEEIDLLHEWIDNGMPYGDISITPPLPEFLPQGSLLDRIDYTIEMEPYPLQYNTDEYRWFVIENPFDVPIYIEKIEVIPGLPNVVHHADLFLDATGNSLALDDLDPLSGFNNETGAPSNSKYINAWQPGGNVIQYPPSWGFVIPPEAEFVFEVHYGPGGQGQIDQTKMNLQFVQDPASLREIKASWLLVDEAPVLIDGPLVIPANEVVGFHHESAPFTEDLSLISICPHMHFLGKSFRVWMETIEGDSIPLIDIPHWDFHWQKYYVFQKLQKLPQGAVLKSEGYYDNTMDNHDNPNNPPVTVSEGLNTTDEMFLCYFTFTDYQEGDEEILMDSSLLVSNVSELIIEYPIKLFPNPAQERIHWSVEMPNVLSLKLLDVNGTVIDRWSNEEIGELNNQLDISALSSGIYFLEWKNHQKNQVRKFDKF